MKTMIAVLAFMMLSQAQAQTGQTQVNQPAATSRPTMVYDERTNQLNEVRPAQVVQAVPAQTATAQAVQPQPTGSPIYILNNQNQRFNGSVDNNANSQAGARQESAQVQEQPTSIVQDTPLRAGVADSARRSRQETEAATEDGIVQALEKARMNDEIRRREKFSNALNGDNSPSTSPAAPLPESRPAPAPAQQEAAAPVQAAPPIINVVIPQPAPAPAPVVVAPQPPVVIEEAPRATEVRAQAPEVAPVEEARQEYYVSALVGMAKYPDVINIRGNMAAGVAVGMNTASRFAGEVSFLYSSYELQDIFYSYSAGRMVDMTQYNLAVAGKYNILVGRLRPFVGVIGSYTRRNYYDQWTGGYNNDAFRNSNSFDAGGLVGVDFALTERFAIGADFRYLTNVYTRQSNNYPMTFGNPYMRNEIERLDYYTAGVTAKYTF